ncbi:SRPBCC family protein (plasmid) [Sinorhizobium sp. BG8]|nr:SRPBCC family protein [Sinorhizobium sp. BG8]QRM57407.1 SRPBCC family protein [Sinorhizobium sp. BG8]
MTKVTISSVIAAPIEKVWERIRDYNGLPSWHPRMVKSEIEDGLPADQIGCVRKFELVSGATIREELIAFSDSDRFVTYSILETPQPISNHQATLSLRRITDGDHTFAEWTASFDAPPEEAEKVAKGMGENVFQGGSMR